VTEYETGIKPVWTYPPDPTDKGQSYRQLAPTLGNGILYAATATKTVQVAKVNKSLHFRRRLSDFFAPIWGLPLVAVYVAVRDKIRSEGIAVTANISRRFGGAFNIQKLSAGRTT
jgi:hypothetical protein